MSAVSPNPPLPSSSPHSASSVGDTRFSPGEDSTPEGSDSALSNIMAGSVAEYDLESMLHPPSQIRVDTLSGFAPSLFLANAEAVFSTFVCILCHRVLSNPVNSNACDGHLFCKGCIDGHLVCGNATCPSNEHGSSPQVINQPGSLAPIKMIQKQIAGKKVKCEHRGCAWEGEFGVEGADYFSHLKSGQCKRQAICPYCRCPLEWSLLEKHVSSLCPSAGVLCPNACVPGYKFRRSTLDAHSHSCPRQPVSCVFSVGPDGCKEKPCREALSLHEAHCDHRMLLCTWCQCEGDAPTIKAKDMHVHWQTCKKYPKKCDRCAGEITLGGLDEHEGTTCPKMPVSCDFKDAGCAVTPHRCDKQVHMQQAVVEHLSLMMQSLSALQQKMNEANSARAAVTSLDKKVDQTAHSCAELDRKWMEFQALIGQPDALKEAIAQASVAAVAAVAGKDGQASKK